MLFKGIFYGIMIEIILIIIIVFGVKSYQHSIAKPKTIKYSTWLEDNDINTKAINEMLFDYYLNLKD